MPIERELVRSPPRISYFAGDWGTVVHVASQRTVVTYKRGHPQCLGTALLTSPLDQSTRLKSGKVAGFRKSSYPDVPLTYLLIYIRRFPIRDCMFPPTSNMWWHRMAQRGQTKPLSHKSSLKKRSGLPCRRFLYSRTFKINEQTTICFSVPLGRAAPAFQAPYSGGRWTLV